MDTRPNFVCVDTRPKCVFGYASQVVCMDTRPELCVWIRVPTSCTDTRPKLTSRYASRMSYLLRYVTSVYTRVHTCTRVYASQLRACIRVPSCVYGYASQVVCMDTRPNFVYGYASQLECLYDFYVNSMVFYGIFMISMVNSMVFPRICVFFVKLLMKVRIFVSFV